MILQPGRPKERLILKHGEAIELTDGAEDLHKISCNDIAKMALDIQRHSYFFSRRRGLKCSFRNDLNGSGTQGLEISRAVDETKASLILDIIFRQAYLTDEETLYEADLIMDQRKDYEPTVNRGKHQFVAKWATIYIGWFDQECVQWRSDITRLSAIPESLAGWAAANLEVSVNCGHFLCRRYSTLATSDLSRYAAAGMSLTDLKARLTCSECGKRGARIMAF